MAVRAHHWARLLARLALTGGVGLLGACATTGSPDPRDPLEGLNRAVFSFNEGLDAALLKPVATGYRAAVPAIVRTGISNVFGNLGDAWSAVNHLLQGKPQQAAEMGMRFSTNMLFGLGGLLDPASDLGLTRQSEDFGQTLARWGVSNGPYLVLPLLGPSTLRDTVALPVDYRAAPSGLLKEPRDANSLTALQLVSTRASLLEASRTLDEAALDKYTLLRDGWLARRRNQIYDGDPPEEADPAPSK